MRPVLAIVRKDLLHLWPQITVFMALLVLSALLDPTYTHHQVSTAESLIEFALPLACLYLVATVIHEEASSGRLRYWLTSSIPGTGLLAAKALVSLQRSSICRCLFARRSCSAWMGIRPRQHLSTLLWRRQVFLSAILSLPAAALASLTRNLKQVILAILICRRRCCC